MTLSILLLQLINVQVKKLSESNEAVCAVFMPNNKLWIWNTWLIMNKVNIKDSFICHRFSSAVSYTFYLIQIG